MTPSSTAVFRDVEAFRGVCDEARRLGRIVGLVPTMGALHAGHLALVADARRRSSFVAVSIFVNPTQFGPQEDLAAYPRTFEADRSACEKSGVDCIFAPTSEKMYPPGEQTRVRVGALTDALCGPVRPGHFEGVATIVAKLLAVTGPCVAIFGRKDYQQLKVIERMMRDLLLPVEVVGHPTLREPDGLAMSSRNAYLSADERAKAAHIPRGLTDAVRAFEHGDRSVCALRQRVLDRMQSVADSVEYVTVADAQSLAPLQDEASIETPAVLALAVRIGRARLIDNVVLGEDAAPVTERQG